ncbi:MAG TPA: glucose-1-phosphate adenylyltransferase [Candidatus Thiothrix moscowensis]|uniref:glucose-1-phosphate adenylyltransferase n=1 Tax=unclassified Thiothrix TaxID=2636184 RepID=UPI001A1B468F|nr:MULTISPECIES: glucose-1-phosphate adenylyltransferase [unclassified Thiothrix]MBJ6610286.1 glucose-1-phosphate adenylyltransferase [Candidatus Thiothrix moscowensis]HRJ52830.1 glucose-1-phosphate adenylyltransferase [Candidatus Thiothrix moscowensis]HRJ94401.1 glucose-1-phosphate adenylyltransferase [Candidatus Thiothrix moscowensis]
MSTYHPRFVSLLTRDTLALVLAGGRGSRLYELTDRRAKPAVFFGGKFRIIDFPLSNCVNSGIRKIGVITQYKAHSLIRHLVQGWSHFRTDLGEFMEVLPASQRIAANWYEGTADAIYQNLDIVEALHPKYVLVLSGDHVYKMDYGEMLAYHVEKGADMTVSCVGVSLEEAKGFGVMTVDDNHRVRAFDEKPANPQAMPGSDDTALASMGNYIFNTDFLFEQLRKDAANSASSHDFGKDIIPDIIAGHKVFAYPFRDPVTGNQPYWRDVGTLDAFWEANMELVAVNPELDLYDESWPILTYHRQLPSAKFVHQEPGREGKALGSVVSAGCVISGASVVNSLLFSNVKAHSWSTVRDSVLLPEVDIGRHCRINRAIIDRGCRLPEGTVIGEDPQADAERFRVTKKGVVLVTQEMLGQ